MWRVPGDGREKGREGWRLLERERWWTSEEEDFGKG